MKRYILFFCIIASIGRCYAQDEASDFTGKDLRERQLDPQTDRFNFVPNEVLVKFKEDVIVKDGNNLKSAGISSIDQILKANGASSLEKIFPAEKKLKSAQVLKDPTGRDMIIPSLHNIYRITIPQIKSTGSAPADIFKFIQELKALPEVEYAEPNYVFSIGDFKPNGPEMNMLEAMNQPENQELKSIASGLVPNDPLYNSQWGIPATNIDDVWNKTTGDSTAIIAILDTGVDWQHPDLAANIWKNKQEIPGNGIDDDGNGLIDDIRGWDYINNDNNPMDDNSHGTHCAGIAAAVGNNGIGIAGVNWKAKIMPVKVFQSSAKGDAATIAKGITYAAKKGATVISMSFGSYTESLTMKNALASAYATSVLVAAAGNDAIPIGPCVGCAPVFPGAFSFVLGVEANKQKPDLNGFRAGFSNFDQDGPVFSRYADLLNYELKAPGEGIISCVPGGNYREYSGTSMATPLVAGAISLYRKQKQNESQEMMFGNLINSLGQQLDLEKALNIASEPKLSIVSYLLTDTIGGDRDGQADAGETIELKLKVRNTWGQADNVKVSIEFGEFEDKTTATILTAEANIGSVPAYATKENVIPLKIRLATNIKDGRDIVFKLKTWYGNHLGENSPIITINVENGVELKGIISKNMTLYPNKQYLITDNLAIPQGVTLTIKPGTFLKFADGKSLVVGGIVNAIGTRDSLITFTKRNEGIGWLGVRGENTSELHFAYTKFEFAGYWPTFETGFQILIDQGSKSSYTDCLFLNNGQVTYYGCTGYRFGFSMVKNNCFYNNKVGSYGISSSFKLTYNNIINNFNSSPYLHWGGAINYCWSLATNNIFSNFNGYINKEFNIANEAETFSVVKLDSIYHGSTNEAKINDGIIDFPERGKGIWFDITNRLYRPVREAHGIVWKILVNGKDAQDQYAQLDPLGVGKQKMQIYFNRAMDIKIPPTVSMGVRYPFSQTAIAENGSWSADSTIYSVNVTIGLGTGDGINTIRVTGARDTDHFEIPFEDQRFRVVVNAAGSLSDGFEATPGMGKVTLKWENPDEGVTDLLGYNIYRFAYKANLTSTDTVMINSTMITGTSFTDFNVLPGTKYFYTYKTVRTNLSESDFSKVVASTPLTASKGDANGDLAVNILDVTSIVAYLLNNHPQPFIVESADLNNDGNVNVLDIIGVVNLVLGNKSAVLASTEQAKLYMQNDTLFADVPVPIGGIQFEIFGAASLEAIQRLKALEGFESGYSISENGLRLLYYSLSGKNIPAGKHIPLLKLKKGNGVSEAILADKTGAAIPVNYLSTGVWNLSDKLSSSVAELGQNFPNPLNKQTTIPLRINEPVDEAVIRILNVFGQEVETFRLSHPFVGEHMLHWISGENKGFYAYLLEISRGNQRFICPVRKMIIQ